jgi:hypothetical protein
MASPAGRPARDGARPHTGTVLRLQRIVSLIAGYPIIPIQLLWRHTVNGVGLVVLGGATFFVTAAVFWALLPRGGKLHRWANTELEPYVSVAICAGFALGFTMMLSGILNLIGD